MVKPKKTEINTELSHFANIDFGLHDGFLDCWTYQNLLRVSSSQENCKTAEIRSILYRTPESAWIVDKTKTDPFRKTKMTNNSPNQRILFVNRKLFYLRKSFQSNKYYKQLTDHNILFVSKKIVICVRL